MKKLVRLDSPVLMSEEDFVVVNNRRDLDVSVDDATFGHQESSVVISPYQRRTRSKSEILLSPCSKGSQLNFSEAQSFDTRLPVVLKAKMIGSTTQSDFFALVHRFISGKNLKILLISVSILGFFASKWIISPIMLSWFRSTDCQPKEPQSLIALWTKGPNLDPALCSAPKKLSPIEPTLDKLYPGCGTAGCASAKSRSSITKVSIGLTDRRANLNGLSRNLLQMLETDPQKMAAGECRLLKSISEKSNATSLIHCSSSSLNSVSALIALEASTFNKARPLQRNNGYRSGCKRSNSRARHLATQRISHHKGRQSTGQWRGFSGRRPTPRLPSHGNDRSYLRYRHLAGPL